LHRAPVPTRHACEALLGGFASSKILEVHAERMIKRTFDPGFRIALHQKDLNLALSSARQLGVSLPNTAQAQELFNSCVAHGGGLGSFGHGARLERWPTRGQKAPA
jgi:2-hydroxy-3-oxopropionate reductase